jgi:hypothetical protein
MKISKLKFGILILILFPIGVWSQNASINQIFDQYSGRDGYTTIDIAKGLFELFAEIEADDPEFDEFQKAIKGIESMRLLAYSIDDENGSPEEKTRFMNDIKGISLKDFKELMVVKDKDTRINFYARNKDQIINEMVMIVDGDEEAVLLSLYGDIDLNYIAKLGSAMNLSGMHHLEKMKGK